MILIQRLLGTMSVEAGAETENAIIKPYFKQNL